MALDRAVHAFGPDVDLGQLWNDEWLCGTCGLPKRHPVHELPDTPDEDISNRIIGEGQES